MAPESDEDFASEKIGRGDKEVEEDGTPKSGNPGHSLLFDLVNEAFRFLLIAGVLGYGRSYNVDLMTEKC